MQLAARERPAITLQRITWLLSKSQHSESQVLNFSRIYPVESTEKLPGVSQRSQNNNKDTINYSRVIFICVKSTVRLKTEKVVSSEMQRDVSLRYSTDVFSMLVGYLENLTSLPTRCVRVFLSSTFSGALKTKLKKLLPTLRQAIKLATTITLTDFQCRWSV